MTAPYILVIDDEPDIRGLVKEILEDEGYLVNVADSARSARARKAEQIPDLVLLDIWMPGEDGISLLKEWRDRRELAFPVVMMSGHGTVETAVEATRIGAFDFIEKPLSLAKLLMVVEKALAKAGNDAQYESTGTPAGADELVGRSRYVENLRNQIEKLSATDASVLVTGEVASGKALLLHHIHQNSARAGKPFVTVRCDVLAEKNAAIELFGSERAGKINRGALENALGGVLHLGEVSKLSMQTQSLLLSALRTKQFLRVGGARPLPLELRIMTSSTVYLQQALDSGTFNPELYYKLKVVPIQTLGLREHPEDIPALLEYFVDWFVSHKDLTYRHFTVAAQNYLRNHLWPGNIHELKNLVQRLLVMGNGVEILLEEAEEALHDYSSVSAEKSGLMAIPLNLSLRQARTEFERNYMQQQLIAADGSIVELAKRVGLERTHLYRKLRNLGINARRQRR